MIKLTRSNLPRFENVTIPNYDPAKLEAGIVHFGVGNFHRSHQAVYLDDLFGQGIDHDWAVVGAGVRDNDEDMRAILQQQEWLTSVIEQEANSSNARIIAPMVDYVTIQTDEGRSKLMAYLTSPNVRIVSLTITEGGYYTDSADHQFDKTHPDIMADVIHSDRPNTVFGLIVEALRLRREKSIAAFTVMSCDNIPGNGDVTKQTVIGVAKLTNPDLAEWIASYVMFPNSMVDRITPATGDRERSIARHEYSIDDSWPVLCEEFKQWVIEDKFSAGRPQLEKVGVIFSDEVDAYELMKIRILNGGHAAIAYPAALLDIEFAHDAMEHPLIRCYLEKLTKEEIIPEVPPVLNTDLEDYRQLIAKRFANPKIGDLIRRLCLDGSNRQPKFILPTVADRIKKQKSINGLALVSAFWCRYCAGFSETDVIVEPNDPSWSRLTKQAMVAKENPLAWLEMEDIFGSLSTCAVYSAAFSTALTSIWQNGTAITLERYLSDTLF
ncbi:mannitol dehydrogenase family protein [Brucellaceae bacterium C25G]